MIPNGRRPRGFRRGPSWAIPLAILLVGTALLAAACRQATPAEVGTQTTRDAQPMATMKASNRAHDASPAEVSPAAAGAAMAQPR